MRTSRTASIALACALLAGAARAQDSVSLGGCFPGDAVDPWTAQFGPNGTEQCDAYVVDLTPVSSSWGNSFGVAPLVKAGKIDPFFFFTSLMAGSGISRDLLGARRFSAAEYQAWSQPGFGINNDPAFNVPGALVPAANLRGPQFGIVFQDNGFTSQGSAYAGVVAAVVNIDPSNPERLYVNRVRVATNSCDPQSDLAAIGVGSVDALGNVVFRADGFGLSLLGCGFPPVTGDNIYLVDALARNCAALNIVSGVSSSLDGGATVQLVTAALNNTHACPALMPESVHGGGTPVYLGTDFAGNFVRGTNPGNIVSDNSYLDPFLGGTRGNLAYSQRNFGPLGSSHGICAMLGSTQGATHLNTWGLDGNANVTGVLAFALPAVVVDNATGFVNAAGANEFDHYHSQVPFQGGNGQVAIGYDVAGNLLLAAEVDHPDTAGTNHQWGGNYIAVCRVDKVSAVPSWTMAGYVDPATGMGKPILDGPGGNPVARMRMSATTPSVSAPMIDAAGNVYFVATIEVLATAQNAAGLVKAVYDPASFSYELELVMKTGDILPGQNSATPYLITSLRLADSNSIASDAPWSQCITEPGFMGYSGSCYAPSDARTLGGIVVAANVVYDRDGDNTFDADDCSTSGSLDEEYRVLLYVGALGDSGVKAYGQGCPGTGGIQPALTWQGCPSTGQSITFGIDSALGGQNALLFMSFTGPAAAPIGGGCVLNLNAPLFGPFVLPLFGAGAGNGAISASTVLPPVPPGAKVWMQAFCTDPTPFINVSSTRGLEITFQ